MTRRGKDSAGKYIALYKSNYDMYRIACTVVIVLLFYLLSFFLFFLNGVVNLLNYTRLFTPYSVNILGQYHKIITPSFYNFTQEYALVENNSVLVLN